MITNTNKADYIPHHEPFQYYKSTANLTHARPTSVTTVGQTDAALHQYDVHDFYDAINAGNYPAVSFLKAAGYQDGHPGYSDPLDEQTFIVHVVNFLQQNSGDWAHTAVVILYDDSDGWYDHQMPPIVNQSTSPADALTATGACGNGQNAMAGRQWACACTRPLRIRSAATVPGNLAVVEVKLCGSHAYGPDFGNSIHRGQLADRSAYRVGFVRRSREFDSRHAGFHEGEQ